uniref:Uncharacterized protein n=1 Tax=Graphocephala atropunctata TaxID=36148 RepID=A0A1B6LTF7_9HEMI
MAAQERKTYVVQNFNEVLHHFREHEISCSTKLIMLRSCRSFSKVKVEVTNSHKVYWHGGVPYLKLGKRLYGCHQGMDNNISKKKKYEEQQELKACSDHSFVKRYKKMQGSKKVGCPVTIDVTRAIKIAQYKISESGCANYKKREISKLIKERVAQSILIGEECYIFSLPKLEDHKFHPLGANAAATEPVDVRVRNYITELVTKGERNPVIIANLLNVFVENILQKHDRSRRRFYPNMKTVRQMVSAAKSNLKTSSIGQENVEVFIETFDADDPLIENVEGENCYSETHSNQPLVFVYKNPNTNQDRAEETVVVEDAIETIDVDYSKEIELKNERMEMLLNKCKSSFRSLETIMVNLDENKLEQLSKTLEVVFTEFSPRVSVKSKLSKN